MKYVFQFLIIGTISFVAEVLDILLPFPIPASVYGLVIMFLLLLFKIIKPEQIADVADFFVAVMSLKIVCLGIIKLYFFAVFDKSYGINSVNGIVNAKISDFIADAV